MSLPLAAIKGVAAAATTGKIGCLCEIDRASNEVFLDAASYAAESRDDASSRMQKKAFPVILYKKELTKHQILVSSVSGSRRI